MVRGIGGGFGGDGRTWDTEDPEMKEEEEEEEEDDEEDLMRDQGTNTDLMSNSKSNSFFSSLYIHEFLYI